MILIALDIFAIALIGFFSGHREVQILIERGSWKWIRFKKWLYWFTDQNKNGKNEDSFHISNGLVFTGIAFFVAQVLPLVPLFEYWTTLFGNTIMWWLIFMYLRNVTMHVLIPKWEKGNPKLMLWYLLPLFGKFIQRR